MTSVAVIQRTDAIARLAQSLGLEEAAATLDASSNALIAQSLRRSVFLAAPCSTRAAKSLVVTALAPLSDKPDELEMRVADVLDDMLATGDLLEMRRESANGIELVLRPAPPAFVKRDDGTFILLGVAGDEITPRVQGTVFHRPSGLRTLTTRDVAACYTALLDMGLIELPKNTWLHGPATTTPNLFLEAWLARLPPIEHPQAVEDLEILDTASPSTFYKGRWRSLRDKDAGRFLARRPQRHGAKLWCLVEVHGGLVRRLVDVHAKDARVRDCDEGWRIQAAFDACAGAPQKMGVTVDGERARLSFYSPIPAWAVRRLSLIGERIKPPGAFFGFELPKQNLDDEIRWLEETLWLARNDEAAA
jgi:hypothetical protein